METGQHGRCNCIYSVVLVLLYYLLFIYLIESIFLSTIIRIMWNLCCGIEWGRKNVGFVTCGMMVKELDTEASVNRI
jgi:hypothetical protein